MALVSRSENQQDEKNSIYFNTLCVGNWGAAQNFVEPFADFFSQRERFVITNDGEQIAGMFRVATESRGFIRRLRIIDFDG